LAVPHTLGRAPNSRIGNRHRLRILHPGIGFRQASWPGESAHARPVGARSSTRASANVASKPGFRRASPGSPPSEEGAIRNGFAEQRSYRPRNQKNKTLLSTPSSKTLLWPSKEVRTWKQSFHN
jgi:hypothetical protein